MTQSPQTDALTTFAGDIPRDLAVLKMENDSIMAAAVARPRDYPAMLADIKAQLTTFKSFAEQALYSKPVGKDENGHMRYARGLSVRAAEALAASYGYNRVRSSITPIDADHVKVEASFTDFQTGRIWSSEQIVSKLYKSRHGGMQRHNDDRFYNVVVKAEQSKVVRECIVRSVPPGLRAEIELIVDEQLQQFLDEKTVENVIAQFSSKSVTVEMLEQQIGKRIDSFTFDDRKTLVGLWNALDAGETTVGEIFGQAGTSDQPINTGRGAELLAKVKAKADQKADQKADAPAAKDKGKGKGGKGKTGVVPSQPAPPPQAPPSDEPSQVDMLVQRMVDACKCDRPTAKIRITQRIATLGWEADSLDMAQFNNLHAAIGKDLLP